MPTLAVVIPTVGRLECLVDTLGQVARQSRRPDEVIIIDQTSGYSEAEYWRLMNAVEAVGGRYFRQEEPNASKARNRGLLESHSDIILFLDDDVQLSRTLVEAHLSCYRDPQVNGVAGQARIDGRVTTERPFLSRLPKSGWLLFRTHFDRPAWLMSGISCNLSVKRELAVEIGGMDENFTHGAFREESDFCVRYARKFGRFRFEPEAWIETLSYEIGGLRILPSAERRLHHLRSEMYFIRKNISFPATILHFACCVYRQWRRRESVWGFARTNCPQVVATAWRTYLAPLPRPKYLRRDCVPCENENRLTAR
jgi:glycosyltransferase involved in cell wall biosynthesis